MIFTLRHNVTLSAPGVEAGLATIGAIMTKLKDELNAAIEQNNADSAAILERLTAYAASVNALVQKIDDLTAVAEIDPNAIRGVITQLNAEHAAVTAALENNPAPPPAPSGGTGEASV
jgi:cytochrome c556